MGVLLSPMILFGALLAAPPANSQLPSPPKKQKEVVIFASANHDQSPLPRTRVNTLCDEIMDTYVCQKTFLSGASGVFTPQTANLTVFDFIVQLQNSIGPGYNWTVVGDNTLSIRDRGVKNTLVADASSGSTFSFEKEFDPFSEANSACSTLSSCPIGPEIVKVQRNSPAHLVSLVQDRNGPEDRTVRFLETGAGATVYVIDGQVSKNDEFNGLTKSNSRVSTSKFSTDLAKANDMFSCSGEHGTHVASLVAGLSYGTAKDAAIVSVAVQPGCGSSGRVSDLAEGLSWVIDQVAAPDAASPAIVTMSLQLTKSDPSSVIIESLIGELLAQGAIVVAAAGNYASDACEFSPAGISGVITVGALDGNIPWTDSNYGKCVDIWAPGVEITGASPDCYRCTASFTGTSQAAPLVAGLAAVRLQTDPSATSVDIKKWLLDNAQTLDDVSGDKTYKSARFQRNWFQS